MPKPEKTALEMMAEDLKNIRDAMERLEKSGLNIELMVLYVSKKARVAITTVRLVFEAQKSFLEEAFRKEEGE